MATDETAAAAVLNEQKINDYLAGASCEWRVQTVRDSTGLHFKIYDSDGDYVPFARLPVYVDGPTVRAIETITDRAYDRGLDIGKKQMQQHICSALGVKWTDA